MGISRMQADKAWLDYKSIILGLLRVIHDRRKGNNDNLPRVIENIERVQKIYSMQESLKQIYGLYPNYSELIKIGKQIEKDRLDQSESKLADILNEAEKYEPIFLRNCREVQSISSRQ